MAASHVTNKLMSCFSVCVCACVCVRVGVCTRERERSSKMGLKREMSGGKERGE